MSNATTFARLRYDHIIPCAKTEKPQWRYTVEKPADSWTAEKFDDSAWKTGFAGFGSKGTPGAIVRTEWTTADIYLRRTFDLPNPWPKDIGLLLHHDEDVEIYLNGVLARKTVGFVSDYQVVPISPEALATLRPGANTLAVHCRQSFGGQYIDVGLVRTTPSTRQGYFPPAVPLVSHDPYFSIWSFGDYLTDDVTRHWTGAPHPLACEITIDGKRFRILGNPKSDVPAMRPSEKDAVVILPTTTRCTFEDAGVRITLTFITPALCDDVRLLGRPVTYVTLAYASLDAKVHDVKASFQVGSRVAGAAAAEAKVESVEISGLSAIRIGRTDQPVLKRKGDRVAIDWGYVYLAASSGKIEGTSAQLDLASPALLLLAYDEVNSIQLMGKDLRPYWRKEFSRVEDLLAAAHKEFPKLRVRCEAFDAELLTELQTTGGDDYARIGALAYRQALAGCGLALGADDQPLMFPKENTSNGCIATVDVHYPASPMFLLFNPSLLEAQLTPVFDYAESSRWKFPFAPHDLGTYPLANGQVYGGDERTEENQMPVEESGNMILMVAGIAKARGNAAYAQRHWTTLTKWANYLREKGFDPENQLCTDDFMGHMAHNVNLSAKTTCALGAYAMHAEMVGKSDDAHTYRELAQQLAARWLKEADDGDHFRLAFDQPNTWSQKYNLIWDKLLELKLFPKESLAKELAYYRKTQDRFGLPLDNRAHQTKSDWLCWTATLGTDEDFRALIAPLSRFLAESDSRVPFADIYNTNTGQGTSMYARPVIGGVFIKLLDDPATWRKWADRSRQPQ